VSSVVKYKAYSEEEMVSIVQDAISYIDPTGWRILVMLPNMEHKTGGGIELTEDYLDREKLASCVAFVCKLGPDCYLNKTKFPTGPLCKEGDWIVLKSYSGNRLRYANSNIELRLISDDAVEAVIKDITKYVRA
jgi:co-chaperonin GroES (HSP10)